MESIVWTPALRLLVALLIGLLILIAMMSNTIAKGVYFGMLVPGVRKETFWRFAPWALLHLPLMLIG